MQTSVGKATMRGHLGHIKARTRSVPTHASSCPNTKMQGDADLMRGPFPRLFGLFFFRNLLEHAVEAALGAKVARAAAAALDPLQAAHPARLRCLSAQHTSKGRYFTQNSGMRRERRTRRGSSVGFIADDTFRWSDVLRHHTRRVDRNTSGVCPD